MANLAGETLRGNANASNHTTGPWKWCGSDLNGVNKNGEMDSVIFSTVEYDDGHYSELHCEQADRRLIAAAPDLLAACEEFIRVVSEGYSPDTCRIKRLMNEAITMAKGDEPA